MQNKGYRERKVNDRSIFTKILNFKILSLFAKILLYNGWRGGYFLSVICYANYKHVLKLYT